LMDKWKELEKSDSEISEAKSKFTEAVKKVLPKIGDYQFFMGESSNPDGLIALLEKSLNEIESFTRINKLSVCLFYLFLRPDFN
ncbi:translationally-controlled tumor protein homolog, partial [Trichonephila clavata]